jgi:ribosomal protein S18 acetylase RimI-like enzyme
MAKPLERIDYLIRVAEPADVTELARLRYEFRTETGGGVEPASSFLARCRSWMGPRLQEGSRWHCWVAESDGTLVGTLWLQFIEKLPNPVNEEERHGYISSVYVSPQYRNAGVGGALLDLCLAECDRADVDVVFLWSTPKSRFLYRRKGFLPRDDLLDRRSRRP